MASIKELRLRIRSLKNTNKITSAMKLVATSKLKRAQNMVKDNRPYALKLAEILSRVTASSGAKNHPLLTEKSGKNVRLYVFTSDKGLCGGFNNSAIRFTKQVIQDQFSEKNIEVVAVGKKGSDYFSRRSEFNFKKHIEGVTKNPSYDPMQEIAFEAIKDFKDGTIDEVYVLYNEFVSVLAQKPTLEKLLPAVAPKQVDQKNVPYTFEPDEAGVLDTLIPDYLAARLYLALLENASGEHGARMTAMDNATKNSKDLINKLTIVMNRARQAAITTELMEIVSGAESLKG